MHCSGRVYFVNKNVNKEDRNNTNNDDDAEREDLISFILINVAVIDIEEVAKQNERESLWVSHGWKRDDMYIADLIFAQ